MTVTTIDLLRHGECEGGSIYRGSTNVPLTAEGWQQMQSSVDSLRAVQSEESSLCPWDHIITSPLQRCQNFSRDKAAEWGVPISVEDGYREMHFGDWEGRELSEVWLSDKEAVKLFYSDPENHAPPQGESALLVRDRLAVAWNAMMENHRGKNLLLVQHGGTIRVLLTWLLKMPLAGIIQFNIPYAGLCRIKVVEDKKGQSFPSLIFLNGSDLQ